MAAGAGGAHGEHDESDRRFFAAALIVVGLLVSGVALVHRQGMAHSSRASDACPVAARGALIGFDAETGDVRWTNIVPPDGRLDVDGDEVHYRTLVNEVQKVKDEFTVVDRTVDPDLGSITACSASRQTIPVPQLNEITGGDDPLEPPIELGGITVMKWAEGIRATDLAAVGLWSTEDDRAIARVDDSLLVTGSRDDGQRTARIDLRTGEVEWSVRGTLINVPPADGVAVTADPTHRRRITGYEVATGERLWTGELPPQSMPPAATGMGYEGTDLMLVPQGEGGRLSAIDLDTGKIRWQADGGSPGRNRRFPEPGYLADAVRSPDGHTVIAVVSAQTAYLD